MTYSNANSNLILDGVWPVMLTAFNHDYSIDWDGVNALTDFYLASGVAGLFAVAQSAEMFTLTAEERIALAKRVVERVAGRVPVVAAGAFGASIKEQAELVHKLADVGVTAVVILTNQLASNGESDTLWQQRAEELMNQTEQIPLGLYECPAPYKRILSAELLGWLAHTGRFVFHKDTCLSMEQIKEKLRAIQGTKLKFFNAEMASLSESLLAGGNGFAGIAANCYPEVLVWLHRNLRHHPQAASELQRFLTIAEQIVDYKYPTSAKYFLRHTKRVDITTICRTHTVGLSEHDMRGIHAVAEHIQTLALTK